MLKNKKQIIAYFLVLGFVANSTFAFNSPEIENKVVTAEAVNQNEAVKALIKEEVKKQVQEEVQVVKEEIKQEIINPVKDVSEKKEEKILTAKEKFLIAIKTAQNEEERKAIFSKFKEELQKEQNEKTKIIESKSEAIFSKFDLIISKLDLVKEDIEKNITSLKEAGFDLTPIEEKKIELDTHLDLAKTEKAVAWIKMQEINFDLDKETVLSELKEVKNHLLTSKSEIKKASVNSKEIIFFIRGLLTNIQE